MKVFISWSNEISKQLALSLKGWLPLIFPNTETFVSSEDIRKGTIWWNEIKDALESSDCCIVCLTKHNISSTWVYFEAGVLWERTKNVIPLLFDVPVDTIKETPFGQIQTTQFDKEDLKKLVSAIYEINQDGECQEEIVEKFERNWKVLDTRIKNILNATSTGDVISVEDLSTLLGIEWYTHEWLSDKHNLEKLFKYFSFHLMDDYIEDGPDLISSRLVLSRDCWEQIYNSSTFFLFDENTRGIVADFDKRWGEVIDDGGNYISDENRIGYYKFAGIKYKDPHRDSNLQKYRQIQRRLLELKSPLKEVSYFLQTKYHIDVDQLSERFETIKNVNEL